jgi:hypothetical protein
LVPAAPRRIDENPDVAIFQAEALLKDATADGSTTKVPELAAVPDVAMRLPALKLMFELDAVTAVEALCPKVEVAVSSALFGVEILIAPEVARMLLPLICAPLESDLAAVPDIVIEPEPVELISAFLISRASVVDAGFNVAAETEMLPSVDRSNAALI